jgi:hypothetical protein
MVGLTWPGTAGAVSNPILKACNQLNIGALHKTINAEGQCLSPVMIAPVHACCPPGLEA